MNSNTWIIIPIYFLSLCLAFCAGRVYGVVTAIINIQWEGKEVIIVQYREWCQCYRRFLREFWFLYQIVILLLIKFKHFQSSEVNWCSKICLQLLENHKNQSKISRCVKRYRKDFGFVRNGHHLQFQRYVKHFSKQVSSWMQTLKRSRTDRVFQNTKRTCVQDRNWRNLQGQTKRRLPNVWNSSSQSHQ